MYSIFQPEDLIDPENADAIAYLKQFSPDQRAGIVSRAAQKANGSPDHGDPAYDRHLASYEMAAQQHHVETMLQAVRRSIDENNRIDSGNKNS